MGKIIFGLTLLIIGAVFGAAIVLGTQTTMAEATNSEALNVVDRMLNDNEAMGDDWVHLANLVSETGNSQALESVDRMGGPLVAMRDELSFLADLLQQTEEPPASASMDPSSGEVGDQITINGTGFTDAKNVGIFFHGIQMLNATPDNSGSFAVTFDVPNLDPGEYIVEVGALLIGPFTITEPQKDPREGMDFSGVQLWYMTGGTDMLVIETGLIADWQGNQQWYAAVAPPEFASIECHQGRRWSADYSLGCVGSPYMVADAGISVMSSQPDGWLLWSGGEDMATITPELDMQFGFASSHTIFNREYPAD
jgi:hypothetical protein